DFFSHQETIAVEKVTAKEAAFVQTSADASEKERDPLAVYKENLAVLDQLSPRARTDVRLKYVREPIGSVGHNDPIPERFADTGDLAVRQLEALRDRSERRLDLCEHGYDRLKRAKEAYEKAGKAFRKGLGDGVELTQNCLDAREKHKAEQDRLLKVYGEW